AFTASGSTVAAITTALARQIAQAATATDDFKPQVSGTTVTFKTGFPAGRTPADGSPYAVKPLNLNTRVNEADQVDTLNVFNGDSPSNDKGTLTATRLTGLGMGDVSIIAGRAIDGGVTYRNLESIVIDL